MQSFHLIDSLTERGAGHELSSEGFVDHFDLRIQPLILVFGVQLFVYVMCIVEGADGVVIAIGDMLDYESPKGEVVDVPAQGRPQVKACMGFQEGATQICPKTTLVGDEVNPSVPFVPVRLNVIQY